jgi:hypothetical protein
VTSADTLPRVVSDGIIELIAGVAAVVFVACMLWSDFAADPKQRWAQVQPIQYASALIVLVCVIVLGIRR